eukprot:4098048-Amphidinium_carterae.1
MSSWRHDGYESAICSAGASASYPYSRGTTSGVDQLSLEFVGSPPAISRRAKNNSDMDMDMKYLSSSPSCLLFLFGESGALVDLFVAAVAADG